MVALYCINYSLYLLLSNYNEIIELIIIIIIIIIIKHTVSKLSLELTPLTRISSYPVAKQLP